MRIRSLTFAYMTVVGLLALASVATVCSQSWERLSKVQEMNALLGVLAPEVNFTEALALERGVYNQVLVSKEMSVEDSRRLVLSQTSVTDGLFENAARKAELLPPDIRAQVAPAISRAWEIVRMARAKGDSIWRQPGKKSPAAVEMVAGQLARAGKLLDESIASAERALTNRDAGLGLALEISNLSNDMRDLAGRRSIILSRYPATLKPFTVADGLQVSELSGALQITWQRLQLAAARTGGARVEAAVARVRDTFFKSGEPVYVAMADAARDGTKPPMDFMEWRKWTVGTLTQTLAARDAPIEDAAAQIDAMRARAVDSVRFAVAVLGGVLLFLMAAGWLVRSQIVNPLVRLTEALDRLSAGRTVSEASETGDLASRLGDRGDEIGSLARALSRLQRRAIELEDLNHRFDAVLANLPEGVCFYDADECLVVSNRRYAEVYGVDPDAIRPGMNLKDVLAVRNSLGHGHVEEDGVSIEHASDGIGRRVVKTRTGVLVSVHVNPVPGGGWLATHQDITARVQAEAQIAHMAHHDALTGLPNRIAFQLEMERGLHRLHRGGELAVMCLDLDDFKAVNDTLGHSLGDQLLKQVATRLAECLRDNDVAARLGGDEFAVIFDEIEERDMLNILAQRIIDCVGEPYNLDGQQAAIGVSIGIAMGPQDGADAEKLLPAADMALYRAKADGRGTYRFFEAEMDAKMQLRRLLELDLRKALPAHEFELYYQPVMDLAKDEITGFEALIRWNHPERGCVSPAEFIPLAEDTGLICEIGAWVLRQACAEAATWPPPLKVAVNLSPRQFRNFRLLTDVTSALADSGLSPTRLELEITEAVMMDNNEMTLATLHQLHDLGLQISMDDFGTGYSSLSYLRRFPFDKIKIDRSFVRDLANDKDSVSIVRAVTGLGAGFGITTTAEGVETNEQLAQLRAEGCTEIQGFLLSPPVPSSEVMRLLGRGVPASMIAA